MTTKKEYTEVKTDFFKFEKIGDSISGALIEKSTQPFGDNIVGRYKVADEDGKITTFLGNVALDDLLENVPEGTDIRITWRGDISTGNNRKMKDMKLEIAS